MQFACRQPRSEFSESWSAVYSIRCKKLLPAAKQSVPASHALLQFNPAVQAIRMLALSRVVIR
jgi:hypothetical protein